MEAHRRSASVVTDRIVVACLLAAVSAPAAASSLWSVGGPEGASVTVLAADPQQPATIYAGTLDGGIWKTTDGAAHWKPAFSGLPTFAGSFLAINAIAADPTVSSRVYAATNRGLYASDDGGTSWNESGANVLEGRFLNAIVISPQSSSSVLVGSSSGVYVTTDAGVNWKASNSGLVDGSGHTPDVESLAIESGPTAGIVAGTNGAGVFGSNDGGKTWAKFGGTALDGIDVTRVRFGPVTSSTSAKIAFDSASGDEPIFALSPEQGVFQLVPAYHPSDSFALNASEFIEAQVEDECDSPCEEEIVTFLLPPAPLDVPAGAPLAATPGVEVLTGTSGHGIFHSVDGGATFTSMNSGLPSLAISAIAGDPASLTRYAGSGVAGVARTTDDARWNVANTGLFASEVSAVAAAKSSSAIAYAATGSSVFKTTNAGVSWQNLTSIGVDQQVWPVLAVDPTNPSVVYTATDEKGVIRTTDGGSTWTASNAGIETTAIGSLAIDPTAHQTIYAGADDGLYRSVDGGAHWTLLDADLSGASALAIDPANAQTMFAGTFDGVFRSTDGGAHWSDVTPSNSFLQTQIHGIAIDPSAHTHVYVAAQRGVWKSTDGGGNWAEIDAGIPSTFGQTNAQAIVIEPGSKIDVASVGVQLGAGNGVYRSADGGATWTALDSGLTNGDVAALAVSSGSSPILYAGTLGGGVFRSPAAAPPPPPGKRKIIPAHPSPPHRVREPRP
jgi:hypothetical protein